MRGTPETASDRRLSAAAGTAGDPGPNHRRETLSPNEVPPGLVANRKLTLRIAMPATLGLFGLSFATPGVRLLWNASSSVPRGLYLVLPATTFHRGDMVAAWPPIGARRLAATRRYLPPSVPLLKHVSALPGERLCAAGSIVTVSGRRIAERRPRDLEGRVLPAFHGCRLLGKTQYLLLGDSRYSFDGRYFGASEKRDIIGRASLLWAR